MTNKALKPIEGHQTPARYDPPKFAMLNRYKSDLVAYEYDDYDKAGKLVTKFWSLDKIGPNTVLIPETHCHTIIMELEAALVPANYEAASTFARLIIGRYTRQEMNDADVYVAEVTRLFTEAPADLGYRAVDLLRSNEWVPNVGHVMAELKPLVEARRRSLRQAQAHLDEHSRRAGEGAAPGERSKLIHKFKSFAPDIKAAVGDDVFQIFWPTLWAVSDDGDTMVLAQPTNTMKILTGPHLAAISKVADRKVELVVRTLPSAGSFKAATGPRPIRKILKDT